MAEEQEQTQEQLEQLNGYLKERFQEYFSEAIKEHTPQVQAAPQQTQEQQYQQQLRDVINPVVQPDIDRARFDAADSRDYAQFYTGHPEHLEYRETVESLFQEALRNGRAMPREAILNYALGKEYRADPAKFTSKQQEKHKSQVEQAQGAMDFAGGSIPRDKIEPMEAKLRDFKNLPVAEMEEVLADLGVTF